MAQKSIILTPITIAAAGTRQRLTSTSTGIYAIIFQADDLNTGKIYVGDSSVSSSNGVSLAAGDVYVIEASDFGDKELDLSDYYVDTATNGNVVKIQYLTVRAS
jgi:hypothetical protein